MAPSPSTHAGVLFQSRECDVVFATSLLLPALKIMASAAPVRLGVFDSPRRFLDFLSREPSVLRPGDGAVVAGASTAELTQLVHNYSMASKGPSRRSKVAPRGPFFMMVCMDGEPGPRIPMDTLAHLVCGRPPAASSLQDDTRMLLEEWRTCGETILHIQPGADRSVRTPAALLVENGQRSRSDGVPVTLPGSERDEVAAGAVPAILARLSMMSLHFATVRFHKKFGRGGFLIRFSSLEALRQREPENIQATVKRSCVLAQHMLCLRRKPDEAMESRVRKSLVPDEAAMLEECIIYTPVHLLAKMRSDIVRSHKDIDSLQSFDPQVAALFCAEVYLGNEPGRAIDDTLVCFFSIHFQGDEPGEYPSISRATGATGVQEGRSADRQGQRGVTEKIEESSETPSHRHDAEELVKQISEANERAQASKAARKRRDFVALVPPTRPPEAEAPVPLQGVAEAKTRRARRARVGRAVRKEAERAELNAKKASELLKLVVSKMDAVELPCAQEGRPPAQSARARTSRRRQERHTLSLSDFHSAVK